MQWYLIANHQNDAKTEAGQSTCPTTQTSAPASSKYPCSSPLNDDERHHSPRSTTSQLLSTRKVTTTTRRTRLSYSGFLYLSFQRPIYLDSFTKLATQDPRFPGVAESILYSIFQLRSHARTPRRHRPPQISLLLRLLHHRQHAPLPQLCQIFLSILIADLIDFIELGEI